MTHNPRVIDPEPFVELADRILVESVSAVNKALSDKRLQITSGSQALQLIEIHANILVSLIGSNNIGIFLGEVAESIREAGEDPDDDDNDDHGFGGHN